MSAVLPVLPWQQGLLDGISPSPAAIVTGDAGIGAGELALAMAHAFCGAGARPANPDLLITLPEGGNISIAAARHIIEFLSLAPVSRERRVALVLRADCLHISAANALLKTLEEPHSDKSLVLWAPALQQLPATIISRCHVHHAPLPPADAEAAAHGGEALLAFAGSCPLAAASCPEGWRDLLAEYFGQGAAMDVAAAIKKMNVQHDGRPSWQEAVERQLEGGAHLNPHCLEWMEKSTADGHSWLEGLQKWVSDGARVACALPPRFFPDCAAALQRLAAGNRRRWLDFHGYLLERRALQLHPLSKELYMREILYAYRRLCAS